MNTYLLRFWVEGQGNVIETYRADTLEEAKEMAKQDFDIEEFDEDYCYQLEEGK